MTYSTSLYPYDTVVRITDTIGGQSWQGSGVLISPDEVLTASHVVYTQGIGTANSIVVTPGYTLSANGGRSSPYGSISGTYIHYFQIDDANRTISNQQSQLDYAVIHLSSPFSNAGTMGIESNFQGGTVNITGYPASAGGQQVTSTQTDYLDRNFTLLDGISIGEGSSGGPVWVETGSGPEVVGIVSSGTEGAAGYSVLITGSVFNQIEAWLAQDDAPPPPPPAPPPPPQAFDDILWQNTNGQPAIWELNGPNIVGGGTVGANPGLSWKAIGSGDFNDDGHSDILWQNTNGQPAIWELDGTNIIGGGTVGVNPGPSWKAIATGDFNDDGHSDLLWQNTNGLVAIWELNGTNIIGGGVVGSNPGPGWKATGTGDFNDDGHSDILWQNANGSVAIWELNGTNIIGGGLVGLNPGTSWTETGTGDFNGDGHSDILWQNANGQPAIWEMNGTNLVGGGVVGANPGLSWRAIG